MVKEYLSQKGVNYEERDVSVNPAYAQELVSSTGQMGVPVIIIDGQAIIGFDRNRLEQILSQRQRPSLGVSVADTNKAATGIEVTSGAYIGKVKPGSNAEKMGLMAGDIIVEINKQKISGANDLERSISGSGEGSRISVIFIRDGNRRATEGKL